MIVFRLRPLPFLALALFAAMPAPAQEVVQALPGTTDADLLAADMRRLAADPRDVDALVDAARLSLRLDDMRAAGALLQRAENVDPRNPRVKAGQGSVLVQSERPGQALRYFAEAEQAGLDPATFSADRALAYDLTGQQERAQRDYARALRQNPRDDETTRRYALSLGISGQRQRALALLDPLVRRSDRAAWRSQAFVLAMTGDVVGAQRIAATMMPGGASGLGAFFERLPTLSASDRAFAVHFGEVRPSPERLADARLAPPVAPLPHEPVVLASAQPLPVSNTIRGRRKRESAPTAAASTPLASAPPLLPARNLDTRERDRAGAALPLPSVLASVRPKRREPVQLASAKRRPIQQTPIEATQPPATRRTSPLPSPSALPVTLASAPLSTSTIPGAARAPVTGVVTTPAPPPPVRDVETAAAATRSFPIPAATSTSAPVQLVTAAPESEPLGPAALAVTANPSATSGASSTLPAATPVQVVAVPSSTLPVAVVERPVVVPASGGATRPSEDSILARIIAGLSIPGSELGVVEPVRQAPMPLAVATVPSTVLALGVAVAPAKPAPAVTAAGKQPDAGSLDKLAAARIAADKRAADKRAAERKAALDKKALADRKAAAEKKALADKEAAEKKVERANPERIWVQVAGGAYAGDLPKAYAAAKGKAPAVFGSRSGYTAPLRATNRVLTGPFKTDAEARAFVNDLKKAGVSAFTFVSDAGQPVRKLGVKGKADDDEPAAKNDDKMPASRSKRRR